MVSTMSLELQAITLARMWFAKYMADYVENEPCKIVEILKKYLTST